MLRFAGFALDPERSELRAPDGRTIRLRPKTFNTLHLLATNAGSAVSKQKLMSAVWPHIHVGDDSLFQCIREIRAALGDEGRTLIKQIPGRGYLLEAEVSSAREASPESSRKKATQPSPTVSARALIASASNEFWLAAVRRPALALA